MSILTFPLTPDYYVNFATGNDTTGNGSLALPWKTVAMFVATAAAGSVCGMMADETISATITLTGKTGNSDIDPYALVSVGADGAEDGLVKYVDGGGTVANGFTCGNNNLFWVFRGIVVKRCTSFGWANPNINRFYKCGAETIAVSGWQTPGGCAFSNCWAVSCAYGFNTSDGNTFSACIALSCSTVGFNSGGGRSGSYTDCVAHACGVGMSVSSTVRGGAVDGCTTGISVVNWNYKVSIVGVQITNNTIGIGGNPASNLMALVSACQFYNNTTKVATTVAVDDDGTNQNLAGNPYKDLVNHDFRTPATAANAAGILVAMYGGNEVRVFPGLSRTLAAVLPTTVQTLRVADLGPPTWGFLDALVGPGTAVAEAHTASEVLTTAAQSPGNVVLPPAAKVANDQLFGVSGAVAGLYNITNLVVSNVKKTIEFAVGLVGTYDPGSGQTTTDSDTLLTARPMTRVMRLTKPITRTIQKSLDITRVLQVTKHFR